MISAKLIIILLGQLNTFVFWRLNLDLNGFNLFHENAHLGFKIFVFMHTDVLFSLKFKDRERRVRGLTVIVDT